MSKKELWVPYNYKGDMLETSFCTYPNLPNFTPSEYDVAQWRNNDPFGATMTYLRYGVGRSAITIYWTDEYMHEYPMIGRYFFELVHLMDKGSITGNWKAIKRGSTYGLVLVDEREIK